MKRNDYSIDYIKNEIEKLKGKEIQMLVNQGRRKYVNFCATIESTHPSIFVVRLKNPKTVDIKSYTYIDILTGNIDIKGTPFSKSKKLENVINK